LAADQVLPTREHLLAHRDQFTGRAIAVADGDDDDLPSEHEDGDADGETDQRALAPREVADHRAGLPGDGVAGKARRGGTEVAAGGAAGALGGPVVAPGAPSHEARILNCSLSRPRVTGEENSTRSSRGEFSRRGISAAAAAACPVSSTPLVSAESSVSHASLGKRSVSSRSSGSGRTLPVSSDWIVVSNRRLRSRSCRRRSVDRTS